MVKDSEQESGRISIQIQTVKHCILYPPPDDKISNDKVNLNCPARKFRDKHSPELSHVICSYKNALESLWSIGLIYIREAFQYSEKHKETVLKIQRQKALSEKLPSRDTNHGNAVLLPCHTPLPGRTESCNPGNDPCLPSVGTLTLSTSDKAKEFT